MRELIVRQDRQPITRKGGGRGDGRSFLDQFLLTIDLRSVTIV